MITEWYVVFYFVVAGALLVVAAYSWLREKLQRRPRGKKMKVKVLRAENDVIDLLVDGVPCTYLASRPQPLAARDIGAVRQALDFSLLESLCRAGASVQPEFPLARLWRRFVGQCRKREAVVTTVFRAPVIAGYIRENGLPLDIDGVTYTLVPPRLLEALEKGDLDGD